MPFRRKIRCNKGYINKRNFLKNRKVISFFCDEVILKILNSNSDKTKFINECLSKLRNYNSNKNILEERIRCLIELNYFYCRSLLRFKKKNKNFFKEFYNSGKNSINFKIDKENLMYLSGFKNKSKVIRDAIIINENHRKALIYFSYINEDLFNKTFRRVGTNIGNKKFNIDKFFYNFKK